MKNNTMKKRYGAAAGLIGLLVMLAVNALPAFGSDHDCRSKECRELLVAAKKATARYHNFQRALDEGFVQVSPCVEHPFLGAMGYHFANISRVMDPAVVLEEPEVLLYMPGDDGGMRLVAFEYVVPSVLASEAPELFGQTFHYDPPPLDHYSLHVWAWRNNPSGIFAPFNPKLSCPEE